MRTTLKRGTGRAADTNGRAQPPITAVTAVSRYRVKRSGPFALLGKIVLWLVVACLVAAGALGGGAWLFFNRSVAAVRATSPEVREAQQFLDTPAPGQPAVAIVIGYDRRDVGVDKTWASRSDTIMLLRADPSKKVVSMLSFPRDLVVDIPGCRNQGPFRGRINEAFTYCGPRGTLQTVKELTGIPINYMVTVNFRAFIEIVDRLGGVYLDIDQRYFNDNSQNAPGSTYSEIDIQPGYQKLSGKEALAFVRFRHTDSDLYRVVRQQEFVKAFKQQISSTWSLFQVPGIVNTITQNVEVAKGGKSELDPDEVRGYAKLVYELPSGNFQQPQIEGLSGYAELSAAPGSVERAVEEFMNPDVSAAERAAAVATGRKPRKPTAPEPADVTVEVMNGNGVAGAADDAAYRLSQRGYPVVNGGNAQNFDYFETAVVYDPARPNAKAAATAMANLFGDAEVTSAPPGEALETTLRVIVGQTFHGTLTPSAHVQTPEHSPPKIVTGASDIAPAIRAESRKLKFPVLIPTVREQSSALSTNSGVRAYRVGDHKALRLTFRTGTGEYWGIQEIDWDEPPILDGPSVTQTIAGREYALYFDGPKLHMVAFHVGDTSYWVVNTLLDRLSNETMVAIARGLKPR
jgi:LCP family protein required for cell wall assembly